MFNSKPSIKTIFNKLIALSLFFSLLIPHSTYAAFTDVPSTHKYKKAIDYLEEKNLVKGFEDGTFLPDKKLTQAEFLTFLLNATGNADEYTPKETATFDDVPLDIWFYGAVETAFQMGIITKNSHNNNFYPHKFVNKGRALELLFEFYEVELLRSNEDEAVFNDLRKKTKFSDVAKTAKKYGILEGDSPQYFRAFKVLSRGELADYIYRIENFGKTQLFNQQTRTLKETTLDSDIFENDELDILVHIWDRMHKDYLYKNKLSDEELLRAAIKGMLSELDDPYTSYQEPQKAKNFENRINNELEGIGVEITKIDGKTTIISIIRKSPAEAAGLEAKDIITKVDGKDVSKKSIAEVANLIRGKSGTKVKVTVKRGNKTKNFSVLRSKINVPEVEAEMLENDIGLISISTFSNTAAQDFYTAFQELQEKGMKALILDLRNNPGGFLDASIHIGSYLIPKGKIITSIYTGSGDSATYFSQGPYLMEGRELAVLINTGSASASEIIAAAIKEHNLGEIIGEASFGKGTVQDVSYYSDGSLLKMTVAQWLTPASNRLNKKGVKPHISIKNIGDKDTQLEKAIETLKTKIK